MIGNSLLAQRRATSDNVTYAVMGSVTAEDDEGRPVAGLQSERSEHFRSAAQATEEGTISQLPAVGGRRKL